MSWTVNRISVDRGTRLWWTPTRTVLAMGGTQSPVGTSTAVRDLPAPTAGVECDGTAQCGRAREGDIVTRWMSPLHRALVYYSDHSEQIQQVQRKRSRIPDEFGVVRGPTDVDTIEKQESDA